MLKTLIMAAMQSGDSLVIIFPLATMLTFTSAVAKLTIRVLGQHHSLLQVISQSYCQVFVKSYNFVFEKINIAYAPYQKCKKTRSSVHIHYISTPRVLSKTHQKTAFLHNISIVSTNMTMTLFRKHFFMEQNNSQMPYRPKIAGILFVCYDPAQFACLQGQYIAAQGCQGRLRHSVDSM